MSLILDGGDSATLAPVDPLGKVEQVDVVDELRLRRRAILAHHQTRRAEFLKVQIRVLNFALTPGAKSA